MNTEWLKNQLLQLNEWLISIDTLNSMKSWEDILDYFKSDYNLTKLTGWLTNVVYLLQRKDNWSKYVLKLGDYLKKEVLFYKTSHGKLYPNLIQSLAVWDTQWIIMEYKEWENGKDVVNKFTQEEWENMGYNNSAVHTDIVTTTPRTITAALEDGSELVIYKDGEFMS